MIKRHAKQTPLPPKQNKTKQNEATKRGKNQKHKQFD